MNIVIRFKINKLTWSIVYTFAQNCETTKSPQDTGTTTRSMENTDYQNPERDRRKLLGNYYYY